MRTHPDVGLTTTLLQLVCRSVTTIARFYVCSQLAVDPRIVMFRTIVIFFIKKVEFNTFSGLAIW